MAQLPNPDQWPLWKLLLSLPVTVVVLIWFVVTFFGSIWLDDLRWRLRRKTRYRDRAN